jgi:hypothetical protein
VAEFFYFFARNQLKSLDSEKLMKGNESFFPFISLHFLSYNFARSSRLGCTYASDDSRLESAGSRQKSVPGLGKPALPFAPHRETRAAQSSS